MRRYLPLVLPSILVFALLIARACIQSVTIDEADAFTAFATRDSSLMWYPVAHNFAIPGAAVLAACSVYFLSAFRLHYFQEWRFNEDTKDIYWVVADVERQCGIHDFSTEWHYVSALNFYRLQYRSRTIKPFVAVFKDSFPKDKGAYIFNYVDGVDFIGENGLAVWYHNEKTGATVAVRSCPAGGALGD